MGKWTRKSNKWTRKSNKWKRPEFGQTDLIGQSLGFQAPKIELPSQIPQAPQVGPSPTGVINQDFMEVAKPSLDYQSDLITSKLKGVLGETARDTTKDQPLVLDALDWLKDVTVGGLGQANIGLYKFGKDLSKLYTPLPFESGKKWQRQTSENLQDFFEKRIQASENIGQEFSESALKDQKGIGKYVTQGALSVPAMAPTLALGATGVGAPLAMLPLIAIAYGGGAREAELEGANDLAQFGAGALTAAVEAATEFIPFDNLFKAGKGVTKPLKALGVQFLSEFLGEGIAEAASPLIARATYDKDAQWKTIQELWDAGITGGLMGLFMGSAAMGLGNYNKVISNPTQENVNQLINEFESKTGQIIPNQKKTEIYADLNLQQDQLKSQLDQQILPKTSIDGPIATDIGLNLSQLYENGDISQFEPSLQEVGPIRPEMEQQDLITTPVMQESTKFTQFMQKNPDIDVSTYIPDQFDTVQSINSKSQLMESDYESGKLGITPEQYNQIDDAMSEAVITKSMESLDLTPDMAQDVAKLKDISGLKLQTTDFFRIMDKLFSKVPRLKNAIDKSIINNLETAKDKTIRLQQDLSNELYDYIVKELGIKAKSIESELVQKYGEGELTKESIIQNYGQETFNKIEKADQWFRSKYDEFVNLINDARLQVYPKAKENFELLKQKRADLLEKLRALDNYGRKEGRIRALQEEFARVD
ncbi:MAG: hypothetical protein R3254_04325, partial [Thiomicrorhabdus sp.]|nr:hypothetical protein [Thiomicrorhabdus sp.]